ncbi:MAG: hypothetical protein IR164_12160 [Devosia sp.]|uniref:hypothetical protein n=1 Tax=unclassified Devosia TaxID=196773 RepID=UPI0019E2C5F2|nr:MULTISPECIES: hypothetical protein [unclassified Devosia]MBF0679676.1 hypothetical protein [Devosia sp.]WEJ32154.1 hypothetical protein NYQ88_14760 [Devosia sp. SD17-2]
MTTPRPNQIRLPFITQRPLEDGCGASVLQILTGKPLAEIESHFGWKNGELRRSNWEDIIRILPLYGWQFGARQEVESWDEVHGLAVMHVHDDHFMLYDADTKVFYDPWEFEGPSLVTNRKPISTLTVWKSADWAYPRATKIG